MQNVFIQKEVEMAYRVKLRKLGFPETLFDSDFDEQYEQSKKLHKQLVDFLNANGHNIKYVEPGLEVVQCRIPHWHIYAHDLSRYMKNTGWWPWQELRKAVTGKLGPNTDSRRRKYLESLGYDIDKLREEHKAKLEAAKKASESSVVQQPNPPHQT